MFGFVLFSSFLNAQSSSETEIVIDVKQKSTKISPFIYGQFIENLGRCINGGIYDEKSPLSDKNGVRTDVLEKVKGLNIPLLRYPGGTVSKIYHWKDGIGPKDQRPKRPNLIWGGVVDNHFGTAEFIQYCKSIGAEPFLVVNMSTGTPEEASDWVEYCNGTQDTYYANLRRLDGFSEPFNVKFWGIGNEEFAVPDAGKCQNVDNYIEDSWLFVKLMKLQDPSIKLVLVGNVDDLIWNKKVLAGLQQTCDFLSVHLYAIPSDNKYTTLLKNIESFNKSIDSMRELLKTIPEKVTGFPVWFRFPPRQEPLKLAIDEWGIWDLNSDKGSGTYKLEYPFNWGQALAVAKFLNIFHRNADIIGLATWAQLVNVLAPIMSDKNGSYIQTIYAPLQAYRNYSESNDLPVRIKSSLLAPDINAVDAVAGISDNQKNITVTVLNLDEKQGKKASISFNNVATNCQMQLIEQITYTAPSVDAVNTSKKNVVSEKKTTKSIKSNNSFQIEMEPLSMIFLKFTVGS